MSFTSIPLDEIVHFDAITSDGTGAVQTADTDPTWDVFEEDNDTAILSGIFTERAGLTGNYRGSFIASTANGFEVGKYYSVVGTGTVNGVTSKCVCMMFRCAAAEAHVGYPAVDVQYASATVRAQFADDFLNRDMGAGTDSGSPTIRTVRQALRFLRNRWIIVDGWIYVFKEDDATESWRAELNTDNTAQPIIGADPAGP